MLFSDNQQLEEQQNNNVESPHQQQRQNTVRNREPIHQYDTESEEIADIYNRLPETLQRHWDAQEFDERNRNPAPTLTTLTPGDHRVYTHHINTMIDSHMCKS